IPLVGSLTFVPFLDDCLLLCYLCTLWTPYPPCPRSASYARIAAAIRRDSQYPAINHPAQRRETAIKRPRSTLVTVLMLVALPVAVVLGITLLVLIVVDGGDEPETLMLPTFSSTALIPARGELQDVPAAAAAGEGEEAPAAEEGAGEAPAEGGPCENPVHLVEAGETLGSIAEGFGLALDDVTAMNQMIDPAFDPNFLSIGQQIVVPVCVLPTPTPAPTPTETPVPTREIPTPGPTATDRPGRAEVEIARVLNPGDVTSEAVEIINRGTSVARLGGWQLVNQDR